MADEEPTVEALDALLAEMPRIAEAVNAFSSEAVQQQAFEALLAAQSGSASSARSGRGAGGAGGGTRKRKRAAKPKTAEAAASNGGKPKRRTSSSGPTLVKELNLAPKGKQSLKEFVGEKLPKTNHERNVVSVYYLSHTIEVSPVSLDHVFTCYREVSWPLPASLENSLATTASKKRFLDTSDMANIRLTPPGINLAEHGLPAKPKS